MRNGDTRVFGVFRLLLTNVSSPADVREALGLSHEDLQSALAHLVSMGLVRWSGQWPPVPVTPEVALSCLMSAQLDSVLDRVSELRALHMALETLATTPGPAAREPRVTMLVGEAEIEAALDGVAATSRRKVLSMHPSASLSERQLEESMVRNRRLLARGVRVRVIHTEAMKNTAQGATYLRSLQDVGVEVRLAALLPFRLILVNTTLAYLSAAPRGAGMTALELFGQELCGTLSELFEYCWMIGQNPLRGYDVTSSSRFSNRELVMLRMFASGMKDEAMARSLGISSRTLRRITSEIMSKIGAESRFQAGVKATELGLLGRPAENGRCC